MLVGPAVLVQIDDFLVAVDTAPDHIDVRVLSIITGTAVADFKKNRVAHAAVDQMMSVRLAGREIPLPFPLSTPARRHR